MDVALFGFLILSYVPVPLVPVAKVIEPATKVVVENTCTGTVEKFLTKSVMKTPAPDKSGKTLHNLGPAEGDSYPIIICTDTQCYRYGNMTFLSGREYSVRISNCNLPGVRIESHEMSPVKSNEAPRLRFRSRRVAPTEYRYDTTRFRRLSVGMSRYWNAVWPPIGGATTVYFRHRIMVKGPVSYMSTHRLTTLKPGRKYFIEVEYFGEQKEVIKIQDEGDVVRVP